MEHQVRQLVSKVLAVLRRSKIAVLLSPTGNRVDHALDQLRDTGLALGRPQLAVKILAGDDISSRLGPVDGYFYVPLLEDDRAFVVTDRGGSGLPLHFVVRGFSRLEAGRKVAGEGNPRHAGLLLFCFQYFHLGTQIDTQLSHRGALPYCRTFVILPQYIVPRQGFYLHAVL